MQFEFHEKQNLSQPLGLDSRGKFGLIGYALQMVGPERRRLAVPGATAEVIAEICQLLVLGLHPLLLVEMTVEGGHRL